MARLGFYPKILDIFVFLLFLPHIKVFSFSNKRRTYEPTFVNTPRNVTVHKNELARLKCRIMHLGPKQVAWRKVSMDYPLTVGIVVFDPKEDITVSYKDLQEEAEGLSQWDLVIKQAKPRHSGSYECQISAKIVYTHYVYLKVLDTPLKVTPGISIGGTSFVNIHEPIILTCNVTGATRAPSTINWFFKGHLIRKRDPRWRSRLKIFVNLPDVPSRMLVSKLLIDKSMFSDKGKYVCRSELQTTSMDVSVLNTGKDLEKREENQKMASASNKDTLENSGNTQSINFLTFAMVICFLM